MRALSLSSPGPNGKRLLRNWMYAKRQTRLSCGTAYGLLFNFSLSARRRLNIGSSPHMINLRGHKAQFSYLYVSRACIFFSTSLCCQRTIMLRRRRPSESKQNFKKLLFKYANARWLAGFLWCCSPGSPCGSQSHSTRVHFRHDWNIFARQYTRAPNEASLMPSCKLILVLRDELSKKVPIAQQAQGNDNDILYVNKFSCIFSLISLCELFLHNMAEQ